MTKTPEQLAREQAEAVLKIQQDAVETQMKMMEQLYGNNPEMLAQMKAQLQATMANQADLVAQAQAATFAAVGAAQSGQGFDPNALIANLQAQAQAHGISTDPQADADEGFENAYGFINQLRTDYDEAAPQTYAKGSPEAKVFGYLLGGIVGNLNGHIPDQLECEPRSPEMEEQVRGILSNFWGIDTPDELGERLSDLLEEGGMSALYAQMAATEDFNEIAAAEDPEDVPGAMMRWRLARHFAEKVPAEAMRGWDIGRAAALVRWGYFVGMIDEDTAHSILEVCAEEAAARFEGWRDFGVSYLFGGLFWRISAGEDEAAEWIENAGGACVELLEPGGAWLEHPWAKAIE